MLLIAYNPKMKLSKIPRPDDSHEFIANGVFSPKHKKLVFTDGYFMIVLSEVYEPDVTTAQGLFVYTDIEENEHGYEYLIPKDMLVAYEKAAIANKNSKYYVAMDLHSGHVVLYDGENVISQLSPPFDVNKEPYNNFEKVLDIYKNHERRVTEDYNITISLSPDLLHLITSFVKDGVGSGKNKIIPQLKLVVKAAKKEEWVVKGNEVKKGMVGFVMLSGGIYGEINGLLMGCRPGNADEYYNIF